MPEIEIRHFIAYLTYNNNVDSYRFEEASAEVFDDKKIRVNYSTEGAAIFQHRFASFEQKIRYYQELHTLLSLGFGHGFAVAMAPESDCSNTREIAEFCRFMKRLDPKIATIVFGYADGYVPKEEQDRLYNLTKSWKWEPYESAKIICGENVEPRQQSMAAKLEPSIDYVASRVLQGGVGKGYKVIREILGVDDALILHNDFKARHYVTVNPEQAQKIQAIADQAFYRAMNMPPPSCSQKALNA